MRRINEIIVHCTATREGRNYSVEDIRRWHLQRGFSDIGYHFVIDLNGVIHTGRPIEKVGAHCKGHNRYSIGVVYVGGLDRCGKAKDTRTSKQKEALQCIIKQLLWKYPKINKITGHNEYANKACPCFNAGKEYHKLLNFK